MAYDPNFLDGIEIPLPEPGSRVLRTAFNKGQYIHHSRYSLLFNQQRGFAACTAHNIDGESIPRSQYTARSFKFDPSIKPNKLQVDTDRGYAKNKWDQGHLTRRKSMSWGNPEEAKIAERESDFYSNIAPQHEKLHDDAWGSVEDWMLKRVQHNRNRACVFAGPVFTEDDPLHQNGPKEESIRIPAGFWKIISVELDGKIRTAGFLLWQRDYDNPDPLPFAPILEQVRLTTIEVLTGFGFPTLRNFDPLLYDRNNKLRSSASRGARMTRDAGFWNEVKSTSKLPLPPYEDSVFFETNQPSGVAIADKDDILL